MKIGNFAIAQLDASKRTKSPSIWQVFGKLGSALSPF
jgi:hypothetical protein